jgi:hypothetical protein
MSTLRATGRAPIELYFGERNLIDDRLGDSCQWVPRRAVQHGGRPDHSDLDGEGSAICPLCERDFFVSVAVHHDILTAVRPHSARAASIPDQENTPMGWVNDALAHLRAGQLAHIRPVGSSMHGRIESGQLVTIAPLGDRELAVDDIVLVKWKGNYLLHLIKAVEDDRVLIGNNLGKINGWVARTDVYGRVIDAVQEDTT